MKNTYTLIALLLIILCSSCNKKSNNIDNLDTDKNELILIELVNSNADYVPLSLSSKSFDSGDLAAIQIYDITDGEVGYANGLFSSINGVAFIGTSGNTYRVVMTVIKSATSKIYCSNGLYGKPFGTTHTNAFNYTSETLTHISESGAQLIDGEEYNVPNIDRYYCTVDKCVTKEDSVIPVYLKRVSFGISNNLQSNYIGDVTLEVAGAPTLTIDSHSGSYSIFTFSNILAAYNADETLSPYTENINVKVTIGGDEIFNDFVNLKRNQGAILKYDSLDDSSAPSFDVEFEDGFDEEIYTVSFEDEDGATTWSSLIPISQSEINSSTQYKWSDVNSGLSGQININDYNPSQYSYISGGIAISNYYNDIVSASLSTQLSVPYKDSETGFSGNNGSKNFAVIYDAVTSANGTQPTELFFAEGIEATIKSLYVANTSYVCNVCANGYEYGGTVYSKPLGATDWVTVIATGYDAAGSTTGSAKFYLAKNGVMVENWNKWSLSNLGNVNKIVFSIDSSVVNDKGVSTINNYVAIDDIKVVM